MMATKVKSAAGNEIEVLSDDEWLELTGGTIQALRMWTRTKPVVVRYLWEHGGVSDEKGGATGVLFDGIREAYPDAQLGKHPTAVTMLMADDFNAPAFDRKVNGKRTYAIDLVAMPETWLRKLEYDLEHRKNGHHPQPIEEPVAAEPIEEPPAAVNGHTPTDDEINELLDSIQTDAPTVFETSPPIDLEVASQVAMSLLTTVVEIISAGTPTVVDTKVRQLQSDLETVASRLAQRLEENERMRRQLREVGDEVRALRQERDGLRSRLRATETNLQAALKGETSQAVTAEINKRIDQFMRVAPKGKGDDE